ncbi:phospholipase b plb1 [Holotrichia oblita]|uniref:Phospholipase b plb1 n=1 Tax=Holotrichia oblita TaxID=644536 RepID=A0ACB9T0C9_HOLOL|nr:phospholipase b plb1 [Holotrichia oblita]
MACPCVVGETYKRYQNEIPTLISKWHQLQEEIATYEEFHTKDFAIVNQPILQNSTAIPLKSNGDIDLAYFAADCFHFSQKGHALVAEALWNSILQPVGEKQRTIFSDGFKCPTKEFPYLYTNQNSKVVELRGDFEIRYPTKTNHSRIQSAFPKIMPFPCWNSTKSGVGRSLTKPTSVHKLRPGDIDVVGAMGDSLVAGNGAMEDWALGTMIENRGISWCVGGQGTWREFMTLPNILKEFNPRLTGYSTGTGEFLSPSAKLNVAFPVSADADALRQAKILVKKIKEDPNIRFEDDWKMITMFFGANDLCSAQCYDKEKASPSNHANKLMSALDYLQMYLPRTFVNLIPVLVRILIVDVTTSVRIKRSLICRLMHRLFCACFHQNGNEMNILMNMARDYQRAEDALISSGRYDTKEDFTVVIQPFMKIFNAPTDLSRLYDEVIDISYITHDCFHFSQKGHALGEILIELNVFSELAVQSLPYRC